jgi:hypothetical protein
MLTTKNISPRNKELLRSLAPAGWNYGGYWNKYYHYIKETNDYKYIELRVIATDLIDGNILNMIKYGVTR